MHKGKPMFLFLMFWFGAKCSRCADGVCDQPEPSLYLQALLNIHVTGDVSSTDKSMPSSENSQSDYTQHDMFLLARDWYFSH